MLCHAVSASYTSCTVVIVGFCLVWGRVCLSRELVSALWFEDTSFLHEQILDTPVGRFSVRQMVFFLVFGLLAYIVSLGFGDLVLKVVFGGVVFFVGAAVALWKVRTLPLEVHLFYLFRREFLQPKKTKDKTHHLPVDQPAVEMVLSASLGVPLRITGILKDTTDNFLPDKTFNININGQVYSKIATDTEGFYSTYIIPNQLGQSQITLTPTDSTEPIQKIMVNVTPVKEEKETEKEKEEEENKNAKTKTEPKT